MKNFFIDTERIKKIDSKRIIYLIIFIISFLLIEYFRLKLRPELYKTSSNNLWLFDSIGNWGGIIVQIFFGLTLINPSNKKGIRLIVFFCLGYIVYEFLQIILPKGTFDWLDILATIIGSLIALVFFLLVHLKKN